MSSYVDWAKPGWSLEAGNERVERELKIENGMMYHTDEHMLTNTLVRRSLGLPPGRPRFYSDRDQDMHRRFFIDA